MIRFMKAHAIRLVLGFVSWGGLASGAELNVPLHFGMSQGVLDENQHLLEGTATMPGALIQILGAANGVYPPSDDGSPDLNNPVLMEVHIGEGIDPSVGSLGKAAGSVMINRYQSGGMVARIFNRPTREDASFYTDSQIYTNSTTTYGIFMIVATQTDQPIDRDDDDGDSLVNSWEKSLGTDPNNMDSDGDGVGDYQETLAGTSALDSGDYLAMVEMIPLAGGALRVEWDAVPGKSYQLQIAVKNLTDPSLEFVDINAPVTADSDRAATVVTNGLAGSIKHFRVLLK